MLLLLDNKYTQWMLEHSTLNGALNVGMGLMLVGQGIRTLRPSKGEHALIPGLSGKSRRFMGVAFIVIGVWVCGFGVSLISKS